MRKSRFTEAQIVATLREFDAGTPAEELARRHGIHANTLRLWRSKYGGVSASDLARLKQLEAENAQMQRIMVPAIGVTDGLSSSGSCTPPAVRDRRFVPPSTELELRCALRPKAHPAR